MRLLRSSRFRRRAGWLAVCLAVAGGVAFVGIHFQNTGHPEKQVFQPGKPQLVPKNPKTDVFTAAEQRQVRAVAVRFIQSAVYRKHVADSFALTTRELHQGLSRADWATGTIPVVPYPANAVDDVRWRLDYSYADEVGLKVAFYPKPRSGVDRQIFEIALQNHGKGRTPHWLVSYWAPEGGVQSCARIRQRHAEDRKIHVLVRRQLRWCASGVDVNALAVHLDQECKWFPADPVGRPLRPSRLHQSGLRSFG